MLKALLPKQLFSKIERVLVQQVKYVQTEGVKCWKCGQVRQKSGQLFCRQCQAIQEPHEKSNYFKVFEIPTVYTLDAKSLSQRFIEMQRQLHPDRFANKSEEEKRISAEFSSLVNDAYKTLQSPMSRAIHLLQLHNESIGEEDRVNDPNFLLTIMELNEQVDEARTASKLLSLRADNRKTLQTIENRIAQLFQGGDIKAAKEEIVRMKYYDSISNKINESMRERGIVD